MLKPIIVIGGGAAGMMAAGTAGRYYDKVFLIEKNNKLGKKLYLTGKGKCNFTNNKDIEFFFENIPTNSNFLYSALYSFDNKQLIRFFENLGVTTKVERGGRVFPASGESKDIVDALKKYLKKNDIEIIKGKVKNISGVGGEIEEIVLKDGRKYYPEKVILATGGLSYPVTGSTGEGYKIASNLGHNIKKCRPSLVPLEVKENWPKKTDNLRLKHIEVSCYDKFINKELFKDFGELIFTDYGFRGALVLSASSYMKEIKKNRYQIKIDLKPDLPSEKLDNRLQHNFKKYSRKMFKNSLSDLLPIKLIPVFINLSSIPADKKVNQITSNERENLIKLFKKLTLNITGYRSFSEAIITSGGVKVNEIDPSTMKSKVIENLFFAGEIINVDGLTGGYNLQIAFSTGYVAGRNSVYT